MKFKIDTREKFTIITPDSDFYADNLTAEFKELIHSFLYNKTNIVLNLKNVSVINEQAIKEIAALQKEFYEHNISFVVCELAASVRGLIEQLELEDEMNITLTETEAWDIVQMEEVERELLGDE